MKAASHPQLILIHGTVNGASIAPTLAPELNIPVAKDLYLRKDWNDTMFSRILQSPLSAHGKYVYSDNDFIFMGKIVEQLSGMPLDEYVSKNFYSKLGLNTTGFKPLSHFAVNRIIPTEEEKHFPTTDQKDCGRAIWPEHSTVFF